MKENEEKDLVPKKRVKPRKKPGNSLTATKALIATPDPSRINVKDILPLSVLEREKAVKGTNAEGPNKYTKRCVEAILRNVAIGMPITRAAQLAGIHRYLACRDSVRGAHSCRRELAGRQGMLDRRPTRAIEISLKDTHTGTDSEQVLLVIVFCHNCGFKNPVDNCHTVR